MVKVYNIIILIVLLIVNKFVVYYFFTNVTLRIKYFDHFMNTSLHNISD